MEGTAYPTGARRRRGRDKNIVESKDHKPDREDEEARIKAAGGFVSPAGQEGCARVDGSTPRPEPW